MPARTPQSVREEQLNSLPNIRFVAWVDGRYKNVHSKAAMVCSNGHEWSSTVGVLTNGRSGCPKCVKNYVYSASEREAQINALPRISFVAWDTVYTSCKSKAVVECADGHTWVASVGHLINTRRGCPKCAGNYAYSQLERESQLKGIEGVRFLRWDAGYKNNLSKATMECDFGHQWSSSVSSLINTKTGCPFCAERGFDFTKPGTLYALRSYDGGSVKIGISNNFSERVVSLRRNTPFEFHTIGLLNLEDGPSARSLERMFHSEFERSGFTGFDGATEWLKFDPQILSLLRILGA